jgi:hypothetical protein
MPHASARLAWARSEKSEKLSGAKFWKRGGGDHGGVVGGERGSGEIDRTRETGSARGGAQTGVRSHAAGDDERSRADFFDGHGGAAQQLFDDGVLERGEQVERGLRREREKILGRGALRAAAGFDFGGQIVPPPIAARRFSVR